MKLDLLGLLIYSINSKTTKLHPVSKLQLLLVVSLVKAGKTHPQDKFKDMHGPVTDDSLFNIPFQKIDGQLIKTAEVQHGE